MEDGDKVSSAARIGKRAARLGNHRRTYSGRLERLVVPIKVLKLWNEKRARGRVEVIQLMAWVLALGDGLCRSRHVPIYAKRDNHA